MCDHHLHGIGKGVHISLRAFDHSVSWRSLKADRTALMNEWKRWILSQYKLQPEQHSAGNTTYERQVSGKWFWTIIFTVYLSLVKKYLLKPISMMSVLPSLVLHLSWMGSRGQQPKQRDWDFHIPSNLSQLLRWNTKIFASQSRNNALPLNCCWIWCSWAYHTFEFSSERFTHHKPLSWLKSYLIDRTQHIVNHRQYKIIISQCPLRASRSQFLNHSCSFYICSYIVMDGPMKFHFTATNITLSCMYKIQHLIITIIILLISTHCLSGDNKKQDKAQLFDTRTEAIPITNPH